MVQSEVTSRSALDRPFERGGVNRGARLVDLGPPADSAVSTRCVSRHERHSGRKGGRGNGRKGSLLSDRLVGRGVIEIRDRDGRGS